MNNKNPVRDYLSVEKSDERRATRDEQENSLLGLSNGRKMDV